MDLKEQLTVLGVTAAGEIGAADSTGQLETLRVKYLGKKGELTAILRGMGSLPAEERPRAGQVANEIRERIESALTRTEKALAEKEMAEKLQAEAIDVTLPGKVQAYGTLHPITQVMDQVADVFTGMGYTVAEGPEIELDYYNFEAL
ncbi:MAG TPA: phenylalanine--tRNA ligase subunit alpha, partial [Clostridiales bacterium]|nr:phenylalanine--tRNA ligase subunit alpha [Clostridiales bacterium]